MVFRKLRNLVSRKSTGSCFKKTANTQPSSDDEQLEPTLVCRPRSSPAAVKVHITVVTKIGSKRKRQDKVPAATTATDKSCKRRKQNPEIQGNSDPFELMMNYFDKHFQGIEKKLQQPSNKIAKMEDTFKFKHKWNREQFEFNKKVLQFVQNLSSALNNDDASEASNICDDLRSKLKRRNKLIKMADRSVLVWDSDAEYEVDPIASHSDDGKKIRQAENSETEK